MIGISYVSRYEIAAIIVCCALIINFLRQKALMTYIRKAFLTLVSLNLISSILDLISIYLLAHADQYPLWLLYASNIAYYCTFNTIPLAFYLCLLFTSDYDYSVLRRNFILLHLPYYLYMLFIVTTPFTKIVFFIDEQGYHHNFGFYHLYLLSAYYVLLVLIRTLRNKHNYSRGELVPVYFYTLAVIVAAIIQYLLPNVIILGFVISVSALLVSFALDNPVDFLDPEMNLFNRQAFIAKYNTLVSHKKNFTMLGLRIVEIRYLNNTIGPTQKKELLKEIADFFLSVCEKKSVFRISRSNFVLILSENPEKQDAQIKEIKRRFSQSFVSLGYSLSLTALLDLVHSPDDTSDLKETIDLIETSFSDLESSEPLTVVRANKAKLYKLQREQKIVQYLESLINENKIEIVYQPIFSVLRKKFVKATAYVELIHPEFGYISPSEFVPLAEKNGLILRLGSIMITKICKFLSETQVWKYGIETITLKLSPTQCMHSDLSQFLFTTLSAYHLNPKTISFDLSETAAASKNSVLLTNMTKLSEKEIDFSLDDYGTGLSNTVNIIQYPFKNIIIDNTLLNASLQDKKSSTILSQTIEMLKELNLSVTVNNLNTKEQVDNIVTFSCDYLQGDYFSKPLNQNSFIAFVNGQKL